jgi:hydrogenase-4 transcriptional activator
MSLNRDQFFRALTLRICSTLDLEKALRRAFPVLAEHFPLDDVYVDILDRSLGAVRRIAHVSAADVEAAPGAASGRPALRQPPTVIPLPENIWRWLSGLERPIVLGDARSEDARRMRALVKLEGASDLALPLRVDGQQVGFLVLRAAGEGRYRQEHAELLASVADPVAIALANTLAHQALLRFRDDLLDDRRFLSRELSPAPGEVIGVATGLRDVMETVRQAAPLATTVLLLGETGVGKDVIANAIHHASPRRDGPFIKVNCGAIPEGLVDTELFGHEAGAFTGARGERRGRFERADGGTIFLDEIGDLPMSAQVRLLRVLQSREIERVGGTRSIRVDIRVVAATHRNLQTMVAERRFREDLWFRLNVVPIVIPPLRLRSEDVPALVRHFVEVKRRQLGLAVEQVVAPGALARLQAYEWPGNVRELENVVERELIRRRGEPLAFEEIRPAPRPPAPAAPAAPASARPLRLDHAMAEHIAEVLRQTGGKIHGPGGAAALLGVNESTLRNRMNRLGVSYGRRARRRG